MKKLAVSPVPSLIAALLLSACVSGLGGSTPPARYFQLMPVNAPAANAQSGPVVGVGPVIWPEYLSRSQRMVRQGDVSLELVEGERWAEPLETNFTRVLRENIARLAGSPNVPAWPWTAQDRPALQLRMEVLRFDSDPAGTATLQARWQLHDAEGVVLGAPRHSEIREPAGAPGGEAAVAAQNRALTRLSQDIVAALPPSRKP